MSSSNRTAHLTSLSMQSLFNANSFFFVSTSCSFISFLSFISLSTADCISYGLAESMPDMAWFSLSFTAQSSYACLPASIVTLVPPLYFWNPVIFINPISPVLTTCRPQQAHVSQLPKLTILTSPSSSFLLLYSSLFSSSFDG